MPFKLLKQVTAHLKKHSRCRICSNAFIEDLIFVLGFITHEQADLAHGILAVICPICNSEALYFVEIGKRIKIASIQAQMHLETLKNDVIRGNEESPPEPYYLVRRQGDDKVDEVGRVFQRFHGKVVSINEVLDMRNFLKNWNGDTKIFYN